MVLADAVEQGIESEVQCIPWWENERGACLEVTLVARTLLNGGFAFVIFTARQSCNEVKHTDSRKTAVQ